MPMPSAGPSFGSAANVINKTYKTYHMPVGSVNTEHIALDGLASVLQPLITLNGSNVLTKSCIIYPSRPTIWENITRIARHHFLVKNIPMHDPKEKPMLSGMSKTIHTTTTRVNYINMTGMSMSGRGHCLYTCLCLHRLASWHGS